MNVNMFHNEEKRFEKTNKHTATVTMCLPLCRWGTLLCDMMEIQVGTSVPLIFTPASNRAWGKHQQITGKAFMDTLWHKWSVVLYKDRQIKRSNMWCFSDLLTLNGNVKLKKYIEKWYKVFSLVLLSKAGPHVNASILCHHVLTVTSRPAHLLPAWWLQSDIIAGNRNWFTLYQHYWHFAILTVFFSTHTINFENETATYWKDFAIRHKIKTEMS